MPPLIVLGTGNAHKIAELRALLAAAPVAWQSLVDTPGAIEVEECGGAVAANARLKAGEQARRLGLWVLADDAGLEVDALNGAPGAEAANFAGPKAGAERNRPLLLEKLAATPPDRRGARFVCHLALADPAGAIVVETTGACHGRIRCEPAGDLRFGYDPLFELIEYRQTFGQLGAAAKSMLSHRGRAARAMLVQIDRLAAAGRLTP